MTTPHLLPRSILKLTLSFFLSIGVSAASTLTSVSCASPGSTYITDSANCYSLGTNGYARANVSTSVTLPATAADAAVIQAVSTASGLETTIRGITATAVSTSSADIGVIFDTGGPLRNGFLELNFNQIAWSAPANGYLRESLAIGSYSANPNGSNLTSVWIPIQLGSQFGFDYTETVSTIASSLTGLTAGDIDSQISLLAFESDQVTPVQLFDPPGNVTPGLFTPEPAGVGLALAGFSGLALLWKFRRLKQR